MYEELIERLREYPDREETAGGYVEVDWQDLLDAADALESLTAQLTALQAENAELQRDAEQEHERYIETLGERDGFEARATALCAALSRAETERDAANERGEYYREKADEEIEIRLSLSKELSALVKARAEGRIVVLPCKPSDVTVYQLRGKKHALGVGVSPRHISCATVWADGGYALHHQGADDCQKKDFGKTWFLTRAEAEAAIGGGGDG